MCVCVCVCVCGGQHGASDTGAAGHARAELPENKHFSNIYRKVSEVSTPLLPPAQTNRRPTSSRSSSRLSKSLAPACGLYACESTCRFGPSSGPAQNTDTTC